MVVGHLSLEGFLLFIAVPAEKELITVFAFIAVFVYNFVAKETLKLVAVATLLTEDGLHLVLGFVYFCAIV
jgi:hypothetical protein